MNIVQWSFIPRHVAKGIAKNRVNVTVIAPIGAKVEAFV